MNPLSGCTGRRMFLCVLLLLAAAPVGSGAPLSHQTLHDAQADLMPFSAQLAAPDLVLKKQDISKSDALAAFAQALIAEDNADADKALAAYQKALAADP